MATASRGTVIAIVAAARLANVEAICSASAKRTSTWLATGSTLQPQIESCALFSTTLRHARARNGAGHVSAATCRALSGSA